MNFPADPRGHRLPIIMRSSVGSAANLKAASRSTSTGTTALRTSAAWPAVAETWIFQPCGGSSDAGGATLNQTLLLVTRQPGGSRARTTAAYGWSSGV